MHEEIIDFLPNESDLSCIFPYLPHGLGGVGLGVSLDAMLDVCVSRVNLEKVYLFDILPEVSDLQRALLETGIRIRRIKSAISPPQLIAEFVGQPQIYDYLTKKSFQPNSWLSSPTHLVQVLDMFEQGKIEIITGDLAGSELLSVAEMIKRENKLLAFMYLSNAEEYIKGHITGSYQGGVWQDFERHMGLLPWSENAVLIRSVRPVEDDLIDYPPGASGWLYIIQTISDWKNYQARNIFIRLNNGSARFTEKAVVLAGLETTETTTSTPDVV